MFRIIQGDVGSGKTIVALLAISTSLVFSGAGKLSLDQAVAKRLA